MRSPPADTSGLGPTLGPAPAGAGLADAGGPGPSHGLPLDREDLKRAQAGDAEALGRFFDRHIERVFSVVQRLVGSKDAAQDVTQDIFLKVRRHIGRLDVERDPLPWLFMVAVNACRDHRRSAWWRQSQRSVRLDLDPDAAALPSDAANPEQALVAAEEERRVQAAVLRLPPDLRSSVILHDFDGLPHEQIAQILGIGHAAARKRHSRALRALADLLEERGTS